MRVRSILALMICCVVATEVPCSAAELASAPAIRTVYLVRHGAYAPNANGDAAPGPGLTSLGLAQARLVAARVKSMPLSFDSLTSSTLTRARQTADAIHALLPTVPFSQSDQLVECTPPAHPESLKESAKDHVACAERLDRLFRERFAPVKGKDMNEIIVAHGNVIRYLLGKALEVDNRTWPKFAVAHASLTIIQIRSDGTVSVIAVGDTGYIPPNQISFGTASDPKITARQ